MVLYTGGSKGKSKATEKKRIINGFKSFPDTAFWRELHPNTTDVQEPANPTFCIAQAPTISEKMLVMFERSITLLGHSKTMTYDETIGAMEFQ